MRIAWLFLLTLIAAPIARADVDATTLRGKVLCGYQGWFRCLGDGSGRGWVHWSRDTQRIAPDTLPFEMWPDMREYAKSDQYRAGDFTYPDGTPATLYSAVSQSVINLHFDWMKRYGIDGVFVQRFLVELDDEARKADTTRVLDYVRAAAKRTGRVYALDYDMTGKSPEESIELLKKDWRWLVDVKHITDDPRYLHHNGKPVLAVFGFYADRMTAAQANRIIDLFHGNDRYAVTLVGKGAWEWRKETDPEWQRAYRRFDVYSPWNVGNWARNNGAQIASTDYWVDDMAEAKKAGMLYLPVIYPGFSWANLKREPPSKSLISRRKGEFFMQQFRRARALGVTQAFIAMFDEVDEGTAIYKVTSQPPTQAHFVGFEGLPSDTYLRLAGEGTRIIHEVAAKRRR